MALLLNLLITGLSWNFISGNAAVSEPQHPVNVILLTYHRSGSSFIGELFSLPEGASYYFEPLHYAKYKLQANNSQDIQNFVTNLMTCDQPTLDGLRNSPMWMIRKFGTIWSNYGDAHYNSTQVLSLCRNATIHVAKTIRLRMRDAADLLQAETIPNLHVIHLVRDPRARFNSVHRADGQWNRDEKSLEVICGDMQEDLRVAKALPLGSNYTLLRYEDMVANVSLMVKDFFKRLYGLEVPRGAKTYVARHTKAESDSIFNKTSQAYYSTFRLSNFTTDHWKAELQPEVIQKIQDHPSCRYVLKQLNYQLLPRP